MPIRFANRRFTPSLEGVILAVVGVVIFTQLGLWQLRRAEQKELLQSAVDLGQQSTLTVTAENIDSLPRFQHVRARGKFDSERQILLDNMPSSQGRPGYRVLTPFILDFGPLVLVDRGWVPMGDRRGALPRVEVDESARTLTAKLDQLPRPGLRMGDQEQAVGESWPRVLNFPDQAMVEATLGQPVANHILVLDASQADGFERDRNMHARFGPEKHIGYAVQWFAFAVCALVIFLIVSFERESLDT